MIGQKMGKEDIVVITLKCLLILLEYLIEILNLTTTNIDLKFEELCTKLSSETIGKDSLAMAMGMRVHK
jgi:hypothetical protein